MPRSYRPLRSKKTFKPKLQERKADRHTVTAHKRGYDSRWRRARAGHLRNHPLCVHCEAKGRVTPAKELDHIIPWRSVPAYKEQRELFWDNSNWQGLCTDCHKTKTTQDLREYETHPVMLS